MMPARIIPVSCQDVLADATAASSTVFPNGATLILVAETNFRFAVDKEATEDNSLPVFAYQPIYTTVGANGFVSIMAHNPSGGPVIAAPVFVVEVLIS